MVSVTMQSDIKRFLPSRPATTTMPSVTSALFSNTSGSGNTAVGDSALRFNTTGAFNTAIGAGAGSSSITGSNNVYIGAAMFGVAGESDACYIKSIFGQTSAGGAQVFINSNNKLGTMTSSKRFKEESYRWTKPAKRFSRLNRSPSTTKRD